MRLLVALCRAWPECKDGAEEVQVVRHHQRGARKLHREVAMVERTVVLALEPDLDNEHDDCVEQVAAVLDDHRPVLSHYEKAKKQSIDDDGNEKVSCEMIDDAGES